jgi:N utilization substance protein A
MKNKRKKRDPIEIKLSRARPEFIEKLFEKEIPEVANGIVKIVKIAREVGYKTKVAVISEREDVEPVGACLGVKGFRIQNIRKEIGGEVIEVIPWEDNPEKLIKNALNLEKLSGEKLNQSRVFIVSNDPKYKLSVVVVNEKKDQQNVIGKEGINVKLAVKLTGWNIDIKTEEEFRNSEYIKLRNKVFETIFANEPQEEEVDEFEEVDEETSIFELEQMLGKEIVFKLQSAGVDTIDKLLDYYTQGRLQHLPQLSDIEYLKIKNFIDTNIEVEEVEEIEEQEIIICPNCNNEIPADATVCPYCGVEFES